MIFEAMRKATCFGNTMRIWIDDPDGLIGSESFDAILTMAVNMLHFGHRPKLFDQRAIAKDILAKIPEISAIEIVDPAGDGVVIYREWP